MISQSLGGGDLYELARVVVPTKRIMQYRWALVFVFVLITCRTLVFEGPNDIAIAWTKRSVVFKPSLIAPVSSRKSLSRVL